MLKAIIFDFDGVLIRNFEEMYQLHLHFKPGSNKETYKAYFDGNMFQNKTVKNSPKSDWDAWWKLAKPLYDEFSIDEKTQHVVKKLKERYTLAIITSCKEDFVHACLRKNQLEIFDEVLGLETEVSKVKKFELFFSQYSLSVDECIFITDTLGDIKDGKEVGIKTVAMLGGHHDKKRLESGSPWKIVAHFEELQKVIEQLSSQGN